MFFLSKYFIFRLLFFPFLIFFFGRKKWRQKIFILRSAKEQELSVFQSLWSVLSWDFPVAFNYLCNHNATFVLKTFFRIN